jgi:C-terminal peptidase prc
MSKATRHALFSQAWMLINDNYVYPDYGGLDWEAVRDEYADKVAGAAGDEEFYDLMRQMVDLLGDQHSSFLSPDMVALENAFYESLNIPGGIGASLLEIDGELVIVQAFPDGPAFEAGLRPGERIIAVDGVPWRKFSTVQEAILAIVGESGTEVVLTMRSTDDAEREIPITRAVIDVERALVQGKMIEGAKIGLLTLNGFDSPLVTELVRETLTELIEGGPPEGLIADVRANAGGYLDPLLDTLALFVDGGSIGSQAGRKQAINLLVPEGEYLPELEGLPVVVLIGPHTVCAGEFFAVAMQLHGGAIIVGQPSAGNTEFISWHELSDGSVLSIAEWIYLLPDGNLIEGHGVQPDLLVDLDWALYGTDDDPQIQAAVAVLGSE